MCNQAEDRLGPFCIGCGEEGMLDYDGFCDDCCRGLTTEEKDKIMSDYFNKQKKEEPQEDFPIQSKCYEYLIKRKENLQERINYVNKHKEEYEKNDITGLIESCKEELKSLQEEIEIIDALIGMCY